MNLVIRKLIRLNNKILKNHGAGIMFNKNFLRYVSYNLKEAEDYEIISKIIKRENLLFANSFLSYYYTKKYFKIWKKIFNYKKINKRLKNV